MSWLDEIEKGAKAATPGPWIAGQWEDGSQTPNQMNVFAPTWEAVPVIDTMPHDAEFIAAARTDVPLLVEKLRIAVKALRAGFILQGNEAYIRTAEDVPMKLSTKRERVVRRALKELKEIEG